MLDAQDTLQGTIIAQRVPIGISSTPENFDAIQDDTIQYDYKQENHQEEEKAIVILESNEFH